jgi:hypothetical protein
VDLILKLSRPIKGVAVGLHEDHLSLEDAHSLKVTLVVFLQVYHLVIQVFVILVSLYHADFFLPAT